VGDSSSTCPAAEPKAQIEVHVQTSTGNPVNGVTVSVDGHGWSGVTDANGDFDFGEVPPDTYTVTGELTSGNVSQTLNAPAGASTLFTLTAPTAQIEVHVQTSAGNPLNGVTVSVDGHGWSGVTDANGDFNFGEVPPDTYTVTGEIPWGKVSQTLNAPQGTSTQFTLTAPKRRVVKITAQLPITPSKRVNHAILPPISFQEFTSTSSDKTLSGNSPTVILRNCSPIKLIAQTDPPNQKDVVWSVEPNPGPAAPKPGLTSAGDQATLQGDQSGGYAISASLDGTTVYWNLVLFEVNVDSSAAQFTASKPANRSVAAALVMKSGDFDITNPAVCAMYAKANVTLTAGGQASLDTYCDRIKLGMCQDMTNDTTAAHYDGGGQVRSRYSATPMPGVPTIVDPAVVVTEIGFPLLDTGLGGAGGGGTIFLSRTRSTPSNAGKNVLVETCDSPNLSFESLHPEFNKAPTQRALTVSGSNQFTLYLVAYSTSAVRSFVAYGSVSWTLDITGTVTWAAGMPTYVPGASAGVTSSGTQFALIAGGQEAHQAGCEVMPPADLDPYWINDAR
jgi:hypothetical protein